MKKFLLYLLAANIFLCYGGVCNFYGDAFSEETSKSTCHSMGDMEAESTDTESADITLAKDKSLLSTSESSSCCQDFFPSKTFKIDQKIYETLALVNIDYSVNSNFKPIFEKSSLKIHDKGSSPKLYLKNSSFLI
ncbi:MAG: hypothetical protein GTN99_05185 [Candidatus Dadabacteria bacterium]|nr:hypothetical protein [Candidatus Dadabacteria bacterium]